MRRERLSSWVNGRAARMLVHMGIREELKERPQILVVCTGNICRSPMGAAVLRSKFASREIPLSVISAGVSNEEDGHPVYPPAVRVLHEHGYEVDEAHRAHRVSTAELENSGLILAMTTGHARAVKRIAEAVGVPVERIHLWREFDASGLEVAPAGAFGPGGVLSDDHVPRGRHSAHSDFYYSSGDWDVPDPWGGTNADFEATMAVVEKGATGIADMLAE